MSLVSGLLFALALGVAGCSESNGAGGSAGGGGDPYPGNCGHQGQGGGGSWLYPGLYRAVWDDEAATYRACVYLNEDCTELEASNACGLGEESAEAHFLALAWTDGRTDSGGPCAAAVSVTLDLVPSIPIEGCGEWHCTSFVLELRDAEGADWSIRGAWHYDNLMLYAERTSDGVVCRSHVDYPPSVDCLWLSGSEPDLCLWRRESSR